MGKVPPMKSIRCIFPEAIPLPGAIIYNAIPAKILRAPEKEISLEVIDKVKEIASYPVTVIGEIAADKTGGVRLVDINGKPFNLPKAGWDHFTV